jgi:hypothetical protein
MGTLDLSGYRPADGPAMVAAWKRGGLFAYIGSSPYLLNVSNAGHSIPNPKGGDYYVQAQALFHLRRSNTAKIFTLNLSVIYSLYSPNYSLRMVANYFCTLNLVPEEFPPIFPNQGEPVYEALLEVYATFYEALVRPFRPTRHQDLHGDNPDEIYFYA